MYCNIDLYEGTNLHYIEIIDSEGIGCYVEKIMLVIFSYTSRCEHLMSHSNEVTIYYGDCFNIRYL